MCCPLMWALGPVGFLILPPMIAGCGVQGIRFCSFFLFFCTFIMSVVTMSFMPLFVIFGLFPRGQRLRAALYLMPKAEEKNPEVLMILSCLGDRPPNGD